MDVFGGCYEVDVVDIVGVVVDFLCRVLLVFIDGINKSEMWRFVFIVFCVGVYFYWVKYG